MSRRKRPSLRRLKAKFMRSEPIAVELVLDTPRLGAYVTKIGFVNDVHGGCVVRA